MAISVRHGGAGPGGCRTRGAPVSPSQAVMLWVQGCSSPSGTLGGGRRDKALWDAQSRTDVQRVGAHQGRAQLRSAAELDRQQPSGMGFPWAPAESGSGPWGYSSFNCGAGIHPPPRCHLRLPLPHPLAASSWVHLLLFFSPRRPICRHHLPTGNRGTHGPGSWHAPCTRAGEGHNRPLAAAAAIWHAAAGATSRWGPGRHVIKGLASCLGAQL